MLDLFKKDKNTKEFASTYKKYSTFTMVPEKEYVECLELATEAKKIKGAVVECGVWRGGMMAGFAEVLGKEKNYILFDSFEGLPPAKEIDGKAAMEWQKDVNSPSYFDNCKAEMEWAEKAMKLSGTANYKLVKGWFKDTIPTYKLNEEISLLHLDADWYESTIVCLENFFPKVAKGGLIILDDYYLWEGCRKALHDYLSRNSRPERVMQYNNGNIHYLVKA